MDKIRFALGGLIFSTYHDRFSIRVAISKSGFKLAIPNYTYLWWHLEKSSQNAKKKKEKKSLHTRRKFFENRFHPNHPRSAFFRFYPAFFPEESILKKMVMYQYIWILGLNFTHCSPLMPWDKLV